jgi:hypothetical protein
VAGDEDIVGDHERHGDQEVKQDPQLGFCDGIFGRGESLLGSGSGAP